MEFKIVKIAGKFYKELNILEETKDVIIQYLMLEASPEDIELRVKNLNSLLAIHWEIERALWVLPRDLLLKIAKKVLAKKPKKVTKPKAKKAKVTKSEKTK